MSSRRPSVGADDVLPVRPEPLGALCATNAERTPHGVALIHAEDVITWGQLHRRTLQVAAGLHRLGVGRGTRVAVLAEPQPAWFEIMHALPWLGAVLVPINQRLSSSELAYVIRDSQAEVLFADADLVRDIRPELEDVGALRHLFGLRGLPLPGMVSYREWSAAQSADFVTGRLDPDDVAIQIYTSGTTGRPKGALLSNRYLTEYVRMPSLQDEDVWGLRPGELPLNYSPMFHLTGIASHLHPAARGVGSVLLERFEPREILRLARRFKSPRIGGVSTMLRALLKQVEDDAQDVPQFRYCTYGADPMPLELRNRLMEVFDCRFVQYYGMTESAMVTCLTPEDHLRGGARSRSVGRAMPGVELRIADPAGHALEAGHSGEICVRSTTMMDGYWQLPERTSEAFRDGWYLTGDGGYLDADGYLYLTDRMSDMLISGGENVYPAEIEAVLYEIPDVESAAVIGVPDATWGEVPKAFIALRTGAEVELQTIERHVAAKLAAYKRPRQYEFLDEMPLTGSRKINKKALRDRPPTGLLP